MTERELAEMLRNNPELVLVDDWAARGGVNIPLSSPEIPPTLGIDKSPFITCEHDLQVEIIKECDRRSVLRPEYSLIFAIPNGGHRYKSVAGKLKAEGVKAGVLDLFLPVARHGYHGMFLETKWGDNKPTGEQQIWMRNLRAEGYCCEVYWDFESGVRYLEWYLEG